MANPIADSAAAIVKINKAKTSPRISSKNTEKTIKLKLIDNNSSSTHIKITIILFRERNNPKIPIKNKVHPYIKKSSIENYFKSSQKNSSNLQQRGNKIKKYAK